jgi:hypothetical protein
MDHFAGLDVSVKETSVCIVDDTGRIVREVKVASEPEDLLQVLSNPTYHFKRGSDWKLGHYRNGCSVHSPKRTCRRPHSWHSRADGGGRGRRRFLSAPRSQPSARTPGCSSAKDRRI